MSFLRRKKEEAPPPPPPSPVQEDVSAQQYTLKLNYLAKSSDGLRMQADLAVRAMLPSIVEPLADSPVETIEPLPMEYSDAAPTMERFNEMQQWVLARREIAAASCAHSQTGEKRRSTRVPVIGLRSSFSRSVIANAAAVAPRSARTISVWGSLATASAGS